MLQRTKFLHYQHENITVYHDSHFILDYVEEQNSLRIIHENDDYFRCVINNDILCDCVLGIIINFHDTLRTQTIFEIGLNHTESGFMAQLVKHDQNHVIFLEEYTFEEKQSFEIA